MNFDDLTQQKKQIFTVLVNTRVRNHDVEEAYSVTSIKLLKY